MENNNVLNVPLAMAFLFAIGALVGWCIEFLYRNLVSHNGPRGKYFINPGFCVGPYLPIYGTGLTVMFLISYALYDAAEQPISKIGVVLLIAVTMTLIEFVAGFFLLKVVNLRLWDYRDCKGNIMGIICPKFSLIWGAIGAAYFLIIHPLAKEWLAWLSNNLPFSFCIGLFWGVFLVDLGYSAWRASIIKKYGDNNDVIVKYEELKNLMVEQGVKEGVKENLISQCKSGESFKEFLDKANESAFEEKPASKK